MGYLNEAYSDDETEEVPAENATDAGEANDDEQEEGGTVDDEENTDDQQGNDQADQDEDQNATPKKQDNKGFSGRVRKLASQRDEAKEQRDALALQLDEANRQIELLQKSIPEMPKAEEYDDDDAYEVARTVAINSKANLESEKLKKQALEQVRSEQDNIHYATIEKNYVKRIEKAISQDGELNNLWQKNASALNRPDFKEVYPYIYESDFAPELTKLLLQDPQRFNRLPQAQFIKEIARHEGRLEAIEGVRSAKKVTRVPEPPTGLNSRGVNSNDSGLEFNDFGDYNRLKYGR